MTVYHPRSWLAAMPTKPRFYLTKSALLTEHPGLRPSDIVTAQYSGPVDDEHIVLNPQLPGATPQKKPAKQKKSASNTNEASS